MVDANTTDMAVVFISIALYNFLELHIFILSTFRQGKRLYLWSFTIATWGVAFNSIGYLTKHRALTAKANLYATLILIGWCTMISGQSVVLYSRLHLLMHNKTRLRAVLIMIMIMMNAVCLHIPVIVLIYGHNSSNPTRFEKPYSIYEKLQLCAFFVQELTLSALYIWETTRLPNLEEAFGNRGIIRVLDHLIYVNILIICSTLPFWDSSSRTCTTFRQPGSRLSTALSSSSNSTSSTALSSLPETQEVAAPTLRAEVCPDRKVCFWSPCSGPAVSTV
jgi:hypothetical protein